jgi:tyrosine-specific transport protein
MPSSAVRRAIVLIATCSSCWIVTDGLAPNRISKAKPLHRGNVQRRASTFKDEPATATKDKENSALVKDEPNELSSFMAMLQEKMGTVNDDRIIFPELESGQVPRMFSSLEYTTSENGRLSAQHAAGSTLGALALVAGTTVGAGVLALPSATVAAGFLPSTVALGVAWFYMTMSGLLIAELSLNRFGETGQPGTGLLSIYEDSLGKTWGRVGSAAYFFLHFAVLTAYISQGGTNLEGFLASVGVSSEIPGQVLFAGVGAVALYTASQPLVQKVNNVLVAGVFATFLGIIAFGAGSTDFGALVDLSNQHPENVVNAFPILFLSMVYQNIVPTVVMQLEGDRKKITTAIIGGTLAPFIMYTAWNAVMLGNVVGIIDPSTLGNMDPISFLQHSKEGGPVLGALVSTFSELALITSLIGFVYGLMDGFTDVLGLPLQGPSFEKYKPALFAAIFVPPLALSIGDTDIFYKALDYGGAFGVSTLFLVLPPFMIWKQRYGEEQKPLTIKPMVPFGKIALGSMWKAAGTLILEQGAEKLGIIEFVREQFMKNS